MLPAFFFAFIYVKNVLKTCSKRLKKYFFCLYFSTILFFIALFYLIFDVLTTF